MVGMVGTYVYVIISLISIEEIHRIVVSTVTLCFRVIGDNNAPSTSTSSSSSFSLCRCRVSRWMDSTSSPTCRISSSSSSSKIQKPSTESDVFKIQQQIQSSLTFP